MSDSRLKIYTDGACSGNPGPGGWAALLVWDGRHKAVAGASPDTTNNRMELMAAIGGLSAVKKKCPICLTTDSTYLRDGITQWLPKWKRNGWQTAQRKAVRNKDLWERLDALVAQFDIQWEWVKGHSGHRYNDMVDELARQAINGASPLNDSDSDKPGV